MLEMPRLAVSGFLAGAARLIKTALLSFAAGFSACLVALPLLVPVEKPSASPTSQGASVRAEQDGAATVQPETVAASAPLVARAAEATEPREPAMRAETAAPGLRVAERIEVEVGRATPIAIGLPAETRALEGSVLILHHVPHGLALFPATPLESGAWSVDAADMKDLKAVRYIHDTAEHVVLGRLLRRDGEVIAEARMTLAARGAPVSESVVVPDVPAAVVAPARPASRDLAPVLVAEPVVAVRPMPPQRSTAQAPTGGAKRSARPGSPQRASLAAKRKPRPSVAVSVTRVETAAFVWPGDSPPRRRAAR